jgi:hypothetical protein
MLAFTQHPNLGTSAFAQDLNIKLQRSSSITTRELLIDTQHPAFNNTYYRSRQLRNVGNKSEFSICHLYLDYSSVILP